MSQYAVSRSNTGQQTDGELIRACQRGESWAWDALIERYSRLIYSIPFKYGLSQADGEDVFQEVCLVLLKRLDTLRDDQRLAAWLISVTTRKCIDHLRKRRNQESLYEGDDDDETQDQESMLPDERPAPEEWVQFWQDQHQLRQALSKLPERCQRFIWHLYQDPAEPSYTEIAASLQMPIGSIGPTRGRCLEQLKRQLIEQGFTW